jgi:hypothetical protein
MKGRGSAEKNEQIPIHHTVWFKAACKNDDLVDKARLFPLCLFRGIKKNPMTAYQIEINNSWVTATSWKMAALHKASTQQLVK